MENAVKKFLRHPQVTQRRRVVRIRLGGFKSDEPDPIPSVELQDIAPVIKRFITVGGPDEVIRVDEVEEFLGRHSEIRSSSRLGIDSVAHRGSDQTGVGLGRENRCVRPTACNATANFIIGAAHRRAIRRDRAINKSFNVNHEVTYREEAYTLTRLGNGGFDREMGSFSNDHFSAFPTSHAMLRYGTAKSISDMQAMLIVIFWMCLILTITRRPRRVLSVDSVPTHRMTIR